MNEISGYHKETVELINIEYKGLFKLSNDELRLKLSDIEKCINSSDNRTKSLDEYLVQVYAIVKETARRFSLGDITVTANPNDRLLAEQYDFVKLEGDKAIYKRHWDVGGVPFTWNMVHYDEQLLGGILLHYGYAIEMATGEGKTLVATLPVFLNALTHKGVHVMTVNDYLSKRDFETTRPIYMFHGLSADCIEYYSRNDSRRKNAYKCDISFGTNSTFIFDYLWDHIAMTPEECVQHSHNFAIVDELDSVLIDDADEPHIVGGGNYYNNGEIFKENFLLVKELIESKAEKLYKANGLKKSAWFTPKGKEWLSSKKSMQDLYSIERTYEITGFDVLPLAQQDEVRKRIRLQNVLQQILLALTVYERDVDYLVEDEKVKIIDRHTGRIKESSRWEHGLHTAIEVKEDVEIQNDFDGMAVISLKNYFRLYRKIAGMSGTIIPVEEELMELYNLQCASLPTHRPLIRKDAPIRVFKTVKEKENAIIHSIIENAAAGRPTLVGSISVKRSEQLCAKLDELGIAYNKLNAKTLKDEAYTIAKAGIGNAITLSTSVAGRGTDIKPSPDAISAGGLMVIGTDMFESTRVDRQLKGRSGRQGDPGSSLFFTSLEDQILKNLEDDDFEALKKLSASYSDDEISTDEIRAYFDKAQANSEAYFRLCRNETARKDDIIAPQRNKFYEQRNAVLFNADAANDIVWDLMKQFHISPECIEEHLMLLYLKTKELIFRSIRNNPNRASVYIPFSEALHTFAILLDVKQAVTGYEYFCKEFKRQIILQIYDKEWKKFVLYMMGKLDKKEIEMLDARYGKMEKDINSVILSRLQYATIPFDVRNDVTKEEEEEKTRLPHPPEVRLSTGIAADAPCPCGSQKKFCECHGRSTHRKNKHNRRR